MGILDVLNGGPVPVPDDIKRLSDNELLRVARDNPYNWSIIKLAAVSQELKNRGLICIR